MMMTITSLISALILMTVDGALSKSRQPAFILQPSSSSLQISLQPKDATTSLSQSTNVRIAGYINPISNRCTNTQLDASSSGSGFGSSNKPPPTSSSSKKKKRRQEPNTTELFELQELRAQLDTILKQNILLQNLSAEKRQELSNYVQAVVEKTESPIDFAGKSGNTMGTAKFVAGVENKSWRMVFSTDNSSEGNEGENAAAGELPFGSTVILRIGEFMGTEGNLDYVLKFSKRVLGLNELVAKSSCSVDIGVQPGLFTFTYEDIKTNVFGVSNLPVGFFGLLKGRVNYIDTVWFDGERWIERNYLENGDVVYNVYVRDVEDEK